MGIEDALGTAEPIAASILRAAWTAPPAAPAIATDTFCGAGVRFGEIANHAAADSGDQQRHRHVPAADSVACRNIIAVVRRPSAAVVSLSTLSHRPRWGTKRPSIAAGPQRANGVTVLTGPDPAQIVVGNHEWENQVVDRTWTHSLEAVWTGLEQCYVASVTPPACSGSTSPPAATTPGC